MRAKVIKNEYRPFDNDKGEKVDFYRTTILLESGLTGWISGKQDFNEGDYLAETYISKNGKILSSWVNEDFLKF